MSETGLRLLRQSVRAVSAGAAYDDIEIGPVPPGEIWYAEWVNLVDLDDAPTMIGVAIKTAGALIWIDEQAYTTAARHYGFKIETYLLPGESLVGRITGCSASSVLYAQAVGQYREIREL